MYDSNLEKDNSLSNAYLILYLVAGLSLALYALCKLVKAAESNSHIKYPERIARIIAGTLLCMVYTLHTTKGRTTIPDSEQLITLGPHNTAVEALVATASRESKPTRFFATTAFNVIPFVKSFMSLFDTIPVDANTTKSSDGRTANAKALDTASEALAKGDCVALFPQGNFSNKKEDPPRIYEGAARLALKNNLPIHVYRQDGFWSLNIPFLPNFVLNNRYYRAFVTGFLPNDITLTKCCVIDFHLKPENEQLSAGEKIKEICAQLYAYYRHSEELTPKQINSITGEIAKGEHNLMWNNKLRQEQLNKDLKKTKEEQKELEKHSLETRTALTN